MPRYTSFLLRVWQSSRHDRLQWAARLEGLQDGRCEHFTDMDALCAHLRMQFDPDARNGPDPPEGTETPLDPA